MECEEFNDIAKMLFEKYIELKGDQKKFVEWGMKEQSMPKNVAYEMFSFIDALAEKASRERECRNCDHRWLPRVKHPKECPACGAIAWDRDRKKAGRPKKGDQNEK